jgi:hypothetical protein
MAIWGNRDREPTAGEAPAEAAPAAATPGNDSPPAAAPEDGAPTAESAPSAGEPAPAPPVSESSAGTDALAPVLAEDVVVIDAEAAVKDPGLAETRREPAETAAPGDISPQRWSEILVSFVDSPRGSVKMAADAVDSAIEEVLASVRARQRALESSWKSSETDTEQLRIALREYHRFGAQVRQMSPEEPARPGTAAAS